MWWIIGWTLLVLAALAFLGLLGWRLVRQLLALGRELGRSAERIGPVMDRLSEPYESATSVLVDPQSAPATGSNRSGRVAGHRRKRA